MGKERKTKKLDRVFCRFGMVRGKDDDIIDALESIPKPARGEYIISLMRFARSKLLATNTPSQFQVPESPPPVVSFMNLIQRKDEKEEK